VAERPTRATVHLSAIRSNYALARRCSAGREPIAVVKADAYGHGAVRVARALAGSGCERFAVATVPEAVALRDAGIAAPLLVLGGVWGAEDAAVSVAKRLVVVVHHAGQIEWLAAAARARSVAAPVHVEVDTGMRRMGVAPEAAVEFLASVDATPELALQGVYTHFARADEADLDPTRVQLEEFGRILEAAAARGIRPACVHAANSAGILAGSPIWDALPGQTATRPGLMLYGAAPNARDGSELQPAMTLRTRVVHLRRVRAGEAVGYAAAFRARADTRIATLAIGYADGVPVFSRGAVLVRGRALPIAGRVSMDYVAVDAGTAPIEIGDEAILFGVGASAEESLPVEQAAQAAGTIAYELMVRVGGRVVREYRE